MVYTMYTEGPISGEPDFYSLYTGASYNFGILAGSCTTNSMVSFVGTFSGRIGEERPW